MLSAKYLCILYVHAFDVIHMFVVKKNLDKGGKTVYNKSIDT